MLSRVWTKGAGARCNKMWGRTSSGRGKTGLGLLRYWCGTSLELDPTRPEARRRSRRTGPRPERCASPNHLSWHMGDP
jgi:hypothetical protein